MSLRGVWKGLHPSDKREVIRLGIGAAGLLASALGVPIGQAVAEVALAKKKGSPHATISGRPSETGKGDRSGDGPNPGL